MFITFVIRVVLRKTGKQGRADWLRIQNMILNALQNGIMRTGTGTTKTGG